MDQLFFFLVVWRIPAVSKRWKPHGSLLARILAHDWCEQNSTDHYFQSSLRLTSKTPQKAQLCLIGNIHAILNLQSISVYLLKGHQIYIQVTKGTQCVHEQCLANSMCKMPSYFRSSQAVIRSVNIAIFRVGGNACRWSHVILQVMYGICTYGCNVILWVHTTSCREVHFVWGCSGVLCGGELPSLCSTCVRLFANQCCLLGCTCMKIGIVSTAQKPMYVAIVWCCCSKQLIPGPTHCAIA